MANVGVIGGGPGGLALAHRLSGAGNRVTVFEADTDWGGLARSFNLGGLRVERYYHFLCGDDTGYLRKLRELGLESELRWTPTKMGFFHEGRTYPFGGALDLLRCSALSPAGRVRYGLAVLYCQMRRDWQRLDAVPAEAWLRKLVGLKTYEATWHPLLKVKFHQYHDQIAAAWMWHRIHRVGRSRRSPFHREQLGYLRGGTETLIRRLVDDLRRGGAQMLSGLAAERVESLPGGALSVTDKAGARHQFDQVACAVPLPGFLKLTAGLPDDYRRRLSGIHYLGVICVVFRLRHTLSPYFWLNVNDARVHFNGCIEYSNLNPDVAPDGTAVLYVPYYLPADHPRFRLPDGEIVAECLAALKVLNPRFRDDWVLDAVVSRDALAQVVCSVGFRQQVPPFQTPVRNLYLMESAQLYPADRNISQLIDLADGLAGQMAEKAGANA